MIESVSVANVLTFFGLMLSFLGLAIGVVRHIGKKIDSGRAESREDNKKIMELITPLIKDLAGVIPVAEATKERVDKIEKRVIRLESGGGCPSRIAGHACDGAAE